MSESASETAASRRRKGDELTRRWSDKAGESEISGDSRAGAEGGGRVVSVISTTPLWPLLYRAMPRWEHLSPPWHPPCRPRAPCVPVLADGSTLGERDAPGKVVVVVVVVYAEAEIY